MDGQTARERADQEFEQASQRLRAGQMNQPELEQAAARIEELARATDDEVAQIEIGALGDALRRLPGALEDEAVFGPLSGSGLVAEVERIVAWGWEELPTTEARVNRVRQALDRIDRLRKGDIHEDYAMRTQRAYLLELLTTLEAKP